MIGTDPRIWTTKDGQKIQVKDMTDDHLMNTIKFIWRNREHYRLQNVRNLSGLWSHTDSWHVQEALDNAAEELANDGDIEFLNEYIPQFYFMLAESAVRELELPNEISQAIDVYVEETFDDLCAKHIRPSRLMKIGTGLDMPTQVEGSHLSGCVHCNTVFEGYANDSHAVPTPVQSHDQPSSDSPCFTNTSRGGGS